MNTVKYTTQNHRWLASVKKLTPEIQVMSNSNLLNYAIPMLKLVSFMLTHKGEVETMRLLKTYRVFLQRYVLKQTLVPIPFCKTDSDDFPKVLRPWKKLSNGSIQDTRLVMSLWRVIESFRCKPNESTASITTTTTVDLSLLEKFTKWLPSWSGLNALPRRPLPGNLVLSNKAGPNGQAVLTAMQDLAALEGDPVLHKAVQELLTISGFGHLRLTDYESQSRGNPIHSKVVFLSDKACKTRVIALGDYWSKTALTGLARSFLLGLRRMRTDLTYRQSSLPKLVKQLEDKDGFYSSDLTAFTDKLPIELTELVVSAKYGQHLGKLWRTVISDRDFTSPKGKIRYAAGNPMGLESSWAVSSFTHHAIKEWCAHLHGIKRYKYLLLGDDCLDTNKKVYETYLRVIQGFGVPVNLSKSTQSENGYTEFAKRLFTPDGETTGLPVDILSGISRQPEQLIELVRLMRERGYCDQTIIPGVQALTRNWKNQPLVLLVLSSPEPILGMPPLLKADEVKLSDGTIFQWPTGESLTTYLEQARGIVFWREVDKLVEAVQKGTAPVHPMGVPGTITENHPALAGITDKLMKYLGHSISAATPDTPGSYDFPTTVDEFSIWNAWLEGKDRHLAQVPSIDQYRFANRGHQATKAKYDTLRLLIALARGTHIIPEEPERVKLSNFELFQLGFPREGHVLPHDSPLKI